MNLNQLRYVIKVAETGSINRAASNLFISQSVLSTSIRNLENELGHEIFIRSSKGIEITPYGRIFLSYITPIEQQLQLLDGFLYRERTPSNQTLSVVSSGFPFVTHICANLYQKYVEDGLHIKQQENFGSEAMSMVSNQLADVGVVRLWDCYQSVYKRQFESMKLEFHPIVSLNIAITVGPNNPLFEHDQEYVTPDMLSDYPMVLYDYMDTKGRYPAEVESYLRIDLPPAEYAQLLDNPPDKKVFAVTYLAYDRQGLMIEYTLSYHLPQYTSFTYVTERKF